MEFLRLKIKFGRQFFFKKCLKIGIFKGNKQINKQNDENNNENNND